MHYRTRAIILKNMDFKEADKIVSIFSEEQGKIRAIAKGVKKPRSSLRGCVQPFCHSLLFLGRGREMDLITQAKILDFYGNSREDLYRALYCMYIMELLDKSLMDKVPQPFLYNRTIAVLELFNREGFNPLALRYFEMTLLASLGYRPLINECACCGKKEAITREFSIAQGGLLCRDCARESGDSLALSGETMALVKLLAGEKINTLKRVKVSPPAMKQLELFLEKYLEYHLERKFYTKNTIRTLKIKLDANEH